MTKTWRQIAWNGIRFETPSQWYPGQIGAYHLILEDGTGPVMEIKWGAVKGTFSHRAHLKRLAALQSRRDHITVAEWILPPPWETALADFETGGFLWQSPAASGRGAILFCPVCRTATLIQFFGDSSVDREKIFLKVLRSLRDHSQVGWLPWAIFDIRANLPQTLQLHRFRFEAGKFELAFTAGRDHIYLHRWAPAAVLLADRDLTAFAGTIPEFARGTPRPTTLNNCQAAQWEVRPANNWQRKLDRFKKKPAFFFFCLWYLERQNRILGVRAEGKGPLDIQQTKQICKHYESF